MMFDLNVSHLSAEGCLLHNTTLNTNQYSKFHKTNTVFGKDVVFNPSPKHHIWLSNFSVVFEPNSESHFSAEGSLHQDISVKFIKYDLSVEVMMLLTKNRSWGFPVFHSANIIITVCKGLLNFLCQYEVSCCFREGYGTRPSWIIVAFYCLVG